MKLILQLAAIVTLSSSSLSASPPEWGTDVSKALSQAKKENKMAFILMGREACGNCQATKKLVNEGQVPVTSEKFVVADINVDDARDSAEFERKFKGEKFGNMLPFVVITDSKGKVMSSYSGFKSAQELTAMISSASAKATAKP